MQSAWLLALILVIANAGTLTAANDFVTGSARYAATVAIDTNLALPAVTAIYSTMDHSATNYTRNPACWAHSLDLTCVPVFNSDSFFWYTNGCCSYFVPPRKGGTLISPRHIIFANHFLVINGKLVIVTVWTAGGAGEGNFIYDTAPINSAMTTLGGGYKLSPIDLSGFTRY